MRSRIRFGLQALALLAAAAVAVAADGPRAERRVTDDTGLELSLPRPAARIISVAPGATELLFAAGAGPEIVGTSEFSDEPAAARRIPRIGDAHAVDIEKIVSLRPDVVVVWSNGNSAAQVATLARLGVPLYRIRIATLADVPSSLERLGALAGTQTTAAAAAALLRRRLAEVAAAHHGSRPLRVFLQVWDAPIYTIGGAHAMSDALRYCGAQNVFGDLLGASPSVSAEAVVARSPEVIVAITDAGDGEVWLERWRRFPAIEAVRRGALVAFEDRRLARLGPGAIEATDALCARLDAARALSRPVSGGGPVSP